MKNKFKLITMLVTAFVMCIGFSSCNEDKGSEISGYYATEELYDFGFDFRNKVYYFVNHNTVIDYGDCYTRRLCSWGEDYIGSSLPNKSGWYYENDEGDTYTYVIEDNKIFITNGRILTIDNGRLLLDGSDYVLQRW